MNFSVIYWNVWLDNQIQGPKRLKTLVDALDAILDEYNPDCLGLNEVLQGRNERVPAVVRHLQKRGYEHVYYLPSGPWTDDWNIGDAIVSKYPIVATQAISLGSHFTEHGRDTSGRKAQAAEVEIIKDGVHVRVIAAHLMNLRLHKLPTHFRHQESLSRHIALLPHDVPVIGGGDFNEFKYMPWSFSQANRKYIQVKTGDRHEPTWFRKAQKGALLHANPDKVFWLRESGVQLTQFQVIPRFTSDHRPLYAQFVIPEGLSPRRTRFEQPTMQTWRNTLIDFVRAAYTVFYVRAPIHSRVAAQLRDKPQAVLSPLDAELSAVQRALSRADVGKPLPRLGQKELLGLMGVLMQFTAVLPRLQPYCRATYADIDALYQAVLRRGARQPLGLADQLTIALRQTDGDLPEALWRLFVASRLYARWYDEDAITGLPDLTEKEVIARMAAWSRAVKAIKPYGSCPDQDAAGDVYYAWTHALAKVAYGPLALQQTVLTRLEAKALEHGTMLNHKLAHKTRPQGVKSDHTMAAAYGNQIGDVCARVLRVDV